MRPNLHRTPAATDAPAFGHDATRDPDAARPLNIGDPGPASGRYTVPVHFVVTHGSAGLPGQIPWLEEIRADQYLSDLHSEVI
ncbi:hypothetical protein ACSYDW_13635 [Paeniglutamicibacter sp. R2-26]|uniref:hypothetical protein n=1 Tax=Paeniglutamicibacter sp. R2-26 TaxID=3144417 RepID=UPI003EE5748C